MLYASSGPQEWNRTFRYCVEENFYQQSAVVEVCCMLPAAKGKQKKHVHADEVGSKTCQYFRLKRASLVLSEGTGLLRVI